MEGASASIWPWVALAGLGAYHGLNPAMGWLFAVALGLNRGSRKVVLLSLAPLALGHAAAVGLVLALVLLSGTMLDVTGLRRLSGAALLSWALWHQLVGQRHRVRVGMQTGLAGLVVWSFVMAGAHGAGLMLLPAVLSLCSPQGEAGGLMASGSLSVAIAAFAVHTGAMLTTIGATAVVVYEWLGVAFLRRGWINLDLIWSIVLAVSGILLLAI